MTDRLVSYGGYVAGWLDTTIHDFLEVLPPNSASAKYALITCFDSHDNPASLREKSPELQAIRKNCQSLGNGLLVPTKRLLESETENRIFFGFDEVWFFPSKPTRPKPDAANLVGPSRLNQASFDAFGQWMIENSCSIALGGGEGLNFVVRAHGLVKVLLGYSIEQPEPTLTPLNIAGAR
jgi:hypothetical protein